MDLELERDEQSFEWLRQSFAIKEAKFWQLNVRNYYNLIEL